MTTACPRCGGAITLMKAAPPTPAATTTSVPRQGWVEVQALVTCKRCGERNLAWQKGRSGKSYLCTGLEVNDGKFYANRKEFHECKRKDQANSDLLAGVRERRWTSGQRQWLK